MVKLNLLEPLKIYRAKPPLIVPETQNKLKKNQAYVIIAPSIQEEYDFLTGTNNLRFRNLYKYYLEKKYTLTLYGAGKKTFLPDDDDAVTRLLQSYTSQNGNMSKIDGITMVPNPKNAARVLKDVNVLVEVNHLSEQILFNPKDRRLPSYRIEQYMDELAARYEMIGTFGNYTISTFIPLELWVTEEELSSPAALLRTNSKNIGAKFIEKILNDPKSLPRYGTIYLTYYNQILPIAVTGDISSLPTETQVERLQDLYKSFLIKANRVNVPEEAENGEEEAVIIQTAEKQTKVDDSVTAILQQSKVDPDQVSDSKKKQIGKVVEKNIADPKLVDVGSEDKKNEVDAVLDIKGVTIKDGADADVMLAAKMEGQSVLSHQRNQMLKEKYHTLKIGDTPLDDLIKDEEAYQIPEVPVKANTVNESMKNVKFARFDEAYNKELAYRDLANILLHFSHVEPALYLNKDIQVTDISTPTDRILRYTVEFEDTNRKRHRFSFQLPKMYKDRYLFLNDQKMNLLHQKLPYPVTKVSPEKCQAVTNYKKIFTERYGAHLSPRATRLLKKLLAMPATGSIKVTKGNTIQQNRGYLTTIEFDELAENLVQISAGTSRTNNIRIYFDCNIAQSINFIQPKLENEKYDLIPLAVQVKDDKKTNYGFSGTSNHVYDEDGTDYGELSEFIIDKLQEYNSSFAEELADTTTGTKFVYSRSRIMDENVPTVLMLSAADPGGLVAVLEKAGIEYSFVASRKDIDPDDRKSDKVGIVPFADGFLVYQRYPYENSLLLNGLNTFPTKEYNFYDMGTRETYVELFDNMFGRRNLVDALQNFYYMFIDPITMDVLIRLQLPTDFTRLLLYCNDILADNSYQIDSDYHNSRIRSNEIIYAHLYRFLSEAWGSWRVGRQEKFSIRENAVIKELLTSNIVDPHSELNIMLETENDRQVKLKGPSGMNEDRSFTLEKRAYHQSMKGIIGMNTTPSGEVGINRHLVLNPNVIDARGFMNLSEDHPEDYDGTELMSPAELMQTFGPESSDIERLAMSISQSKHVVPVESSVSCPISYDMERVIPYISSDYAQSAKKDGKVVAIENDVMIVQYTDGTYDDVDLAEHPAKNTDGGFYIMNQLKTDLKVGSRFKAGELLAYDPKYINGTNDMFGDPLAVMGTMARVAVETNGSVYEDACYITNRLAHRMTTKMTRQKRVILSRFANISKMVKIGDRVNVNDPILVFDDTEDEFSSQLLAQLAAEAGDDDEVLATNAPVISKYTGVIRDIRIYYTIPIEQMTPSMQKIIKSYVNDTNKREKTIAKYIDLNSANTLVKTSEQLKPDSTGKVKGARLNDGIMIDFYIEYDDVMSVGDKLTFLATNLHHLTFFVCKWVLQ